MVVNPVAPLGLFVDEVTAGSVGTNARPIQLGALLARDFGGLSRRVGSPERAPAPTIATPVGGAAVAAIAPPPARAMVGFLVAGQEYALPLDAVLRVGPLPTSLATLPATDKAMLGVVAFDGGVLPLVSPHALLGLAPRPPGIADAAARVVVTRCGAHPVGLVVDAITAIHRLDPATIDPLPPVLTRGLREARVEAICRLDGGRRLITLLAPDGLFDSATAARLADAGQQEVASMPDLAVTSRADEQFVVFRLGDEQYGVPIGTVDEVVRCPASLTRVPGAPAFVEGVMNLHGQVVPVIDQRRRFAFAGPAAATLRRVIVLRLGGPAGGHATGPAAAQLVGFLVDGVTEVLGVAPAEISAAPDLAHGGPACLFDRVASLTRDGRVVLLVDPEALLDRVERDLLGAVSKGPGSPT